VVGTAGRAVLLGATAEGAGLGREVQIIRTAVAGHLYVPGDLCYADDPTRRKPDHEMRLSFGGVTEANLHAGIERLGSVLRKMMKR